MATESTTTPKAMIRLFLSPCISRWSSTRRTNHSKVRHSQGLTRGNDELLKAVTAMIRSGPKR